MIIKTNQKPRALVFECELRDNEAPSLRKLVALVSEHLRFVMECSIDVSYRIAGNTEANPLMRLRVVVGVYDETDPPGELSEESHRRDWDAFLAACKGNALLFSSIDVPAAQS